MRRLKRLPLEELAGCLVPSPAESVRLDWPQLFANDRDVEIEVGFGKGLFLLTEAQKRPQVNFIGIEIERKYQLYAATRIAKRGIVNVRLACADARKFLHDHVPPNSVAAIHVYFPDPWWKKRHQKRRLFNEWFVVECERVLRLGGQLHLATDVDEYFGVMTALLHEKTKLSPLETSQPAEPTHDLDYLTNFERKFRKQGKEIYRAVYERRRAQLTDSSSSS
jgi:tRNA (guanine-N7-)-methyltransferase